MYNVFSFPVEITSINPNNYNKKKLIKDIEYNYNLDEDRNAWDNERSKMHHSFNDYDNKNFKYIDYEELLPLYKSEIEKYFSSFKFKQSINYNFNIVNYTCMKSSQYMQSHYHNNSDFTAVHYLKFDKNKHKPTVFENKNTYATYIKYLRPELTELLDFTDIKNSWCMENWGFNIDEDDFCISPSFLFHHVPKQNSDDTRITIVLNINIERVKKDASTK